MEEANFLVQQRRSERRLPGAGLPRRRGGPSLLSDRSRCPTPISLCRGRALAQVSFPGLARHSTVVVIGRHQRTPKDSQICDRSLGDTIPPLRSLRSEGDKQCRRRMRRPRTKGSHRAVAPHPTQSRRDGLQGAAVRSLALGRAECAACRPDPELPAAPGTPGAHTRGAARNWRT